MDSTIHIVKRNGRKELLDITKIQEMTKDATKGLMGVSQSELELDAQIKFVDGMSSSDIQESLIKTAVEKIDIDVPNWTFVASRLFLYDLYHKVSRNVGKPKDKDRNYTHLSDYISHGKDSGRLLPSIDEGFDLDDLNDYIDPTRDYLFNYLGIKTLYDRYLIKNRDGNPIELPQQMFMAIAMFLAQNEENKQQRAKEFYDVVSKFEVMLATPTLSNARTNRHQLSSCYIGSTPDNIEGIFDTYHEMSLLSKYGGGIGWDWNQVRAMGGNIDGHKNVAGGTVPFLKIVNDVAIAVDQLGTRKGAIAVYLEPWHMDISDFIDLKKNSGEERRRAHDLFPALWITDLFMERVLEDGVWTLFDPAEVTDLSELHGDAFKERYIAYESDETVTKDRIKAKDLWKKILTSYFESGSPFLCFKDNANRANPNSHVGHIRSSNLCVSGDTKLLTRNGHIPIKDLEGKSEECWNGVEWSLTNIFKTSESQKVLNVKLDNETEVKATPYHKWLVKSGRDKVEIKRTYELKPKDKLIKFDTELVEHGDINLPLAYVNGFMTGDGTEYDNTSRITLYSEGKKKLLDNRLVGYRNCSVDSSDRLNLYYNRADLKPKFFIPNSKYRLGDRLLWLEGIFDSDGTLTYNSEFGVYGLQIASINREFLQELRLLLQELGVHSSLNKMRDEGLGYLPKNDKTGEYAFYNTKPLYRLTIANNGVYKLKELGFNPSRLTLFDKKIKWVETSKLQYVKILEVIDEGESIATYCGTEPKLNRLVFNGHLTMNCTEIFQNTNPNHYLIKLEFEDGTISTHEEEDIIIVDGGIEKKANKVTALDSIGGKKVFIVEKEKIDGDTAVCNLASINLSRINTKEDIERVVPTAIRMLDNVIDLNFYPLRKVKATNLKSRSIGLGVMGEAEMLASYKIEWGSTEHFKKIDSIMEAVSYNAIKSSSNLAVEKGIYPTFEGSKWSQGIMPHDHTKSEVLSLLSEYNNLSYDWDELRAKVKKDGMRNGYLMAVAPTSSISILVGTTQAIEPVYKRKWFEENLSGLIPVVVPNLSPETWTYYTPAFEIDQLQVIKAGAIRQRWIDQGQSLNIFMSLDKASGRYLHEIYTLAWKLGLKSTYYLRSQSPEANNDVEDRSMECSGCQ